jgi:hypothetical protein
VLNPENAKGLLSEGILAWRCYIIWGKLFWMKWTLIVVLIIGAGVYVPRDTMRIYHPIQRYIAGTGIIAAIFKSPFLNMRFSWRNSEASNTYFTTSQVWPWVVFALNTALTSAVVLKIWLVVRL